jgi:hypothetical protein
MTPRVLKVLRNFHLDNVFHMGQDWAGLYLPNLLPLRVSASETLIQGCSDLPQLWLETLSEAPAKVK